MKKKKLLCLLLAIVCVMTSVTAFASTKMYAPDGREIKVSDSEVGTWKSVGWYTYPVVKMYAPSGQKIVVAKSEAATWKAVGWYDYPVVTIYAPNGNTAVISKSALSAYKAVGWSAVPNVPYENIVYVDGKAYYIGMARSEMGTADEKLASLYGYTWYVYGTKTYKNFVAAGVENGKVVALVSAGPGFSYCGYKAGDVCNSSMSGVVYRNLLFDRNDNLAIHTVNLTDGKRRTKVYDKNTLAGESKLNFHLVNAFRVSHNVEILKWSDKAEKSARLHSQDMADNGYFSHTNLKSQGSGYRMSAQGINWITSGENIAAGQTDAIDAHGDWINSSGHRTNMLRSSYTHLGVGTAYSAMSSYRLYYTQNFYR